jgi:hypothetical protein
MAHVKKTARPVDRSEAIDSSSDVAVSFDFGLSRVTLKQLDEFTKMGWFPHTLRGCQRERSFLTLIIMRLSFTRSSSLRG